MNRFGEMRDAVGRSGRATRIQPKRHQMSVADFRDCATFRRTSMIGGGARWQHLVGQDERG